MEGLFQAWATLPGRPRILNLRVGEVTSQGERRRFARFPWSLYRGDARWTPPLFKERIAALTPRRNPLLADVEMALFLAEASGPTFLDEAVGTIAAWIDRSATAQDRPTAWFGYLEVVNHAEIAAKLMETAEAWAFEHLAGLQAIHGPASPDHGWLPGLLADGFDQPPVAGLPYNQPYLPELVSAAGYTAVETWRTYAIPLVDVAGLGRGAVVSMSGADFNRSADPEATEGIIRSNPIPSAELVVRAVAEADGPELAAFLVACPRPTDALARLRRPPFVAVAERAGRIVAAASAQPDLSRALRLANGRWIPAGWLADHLISPAACRVHLRPPAVAPDETEADVVLRLWRALAVQAMRAGHRDAVVGPVPVADEAQIAALEAIGARPAQTFQLYEKDLNTGEQGSDEDDSMLW